MTASSSSTPSPMWVAIDITKTHHVVLVEHPDGRRRHFRIANTLEDFTKFSAFLSHSEGSCRIAGTNARSADVRSLTSEGDVTKLLSAYVSQIGTHRESRR